MAKWALDPEGMAVIERLRNVPSTELIEALGATGNVATLPYLAQMIPEKDKKLTEAALKAMDRLLRLLQPSDLRRLDQEIRTRWFYSSWAPTIKPKDVGKLVMKFDHPLAAAAISSMHRSGFIREEAVRRLAALRTGEELPFLLIRAADWVEQVRKSAVHAIRDRLVVDYIPVFMDNLVLLEGESFETGRASRLAPAIEQFLNSSEALPQLVRGLNHPDRGVRRAASRRALHSGIAASTLLDSALDQDDVIVAQVIAKAAMEQAAEDEREQLLERLFRHPFGRLRQLALVARLRFFPESVDEVLSQALFDRQAGVRDIAQRALAKKEIDVAQRYRDVLGERPRIALLGLGESGVKTDAALTLPFVHSEESKVRRAAARAISLLDPTGHREMLLQAFQDPSPGVSRAATQGLERGGASMIANDLWRIMRSSEHEHHRKYAVTL
jgi:HEAT repeat protein